MPDWMTAYGQEKVRADSLARQLAEAHERIRVFGAGESFHRLRADKAERELAEAHEKYAAAMVTVLDERNVEIRRAQAAEKARDAYRQNWEDQVARAEAAEACKKAVEADQRKERGAWSRTWEIMVGAHKGQTHSDEDIVRAAQRIVARVDELQALVDACAPEALRILLGREWGNHSQCLSCGGVSFVPATGTLRQGHADDCAWWLLMRKAGLR